MTGLKDKSELLGSWVLSDGRMVGDQTSDLIIELTEKRFRRIALAPSGWETLYQDPEDGRFWELHFPYGGMQGGGPAALRVLGVEAAALKYGVPLEGG
jgi:Immunity protein 27